MSVLYRAARPSYGRNRQTGRRSGHLRKLGKLGTFGCGILLAMALGIPLSPDLPKSPSAGMTEDSENMSNVMPQRKVYPYSIIPGGVRNAMELTSALMSDKTAAKHYSDFRASGAVLTYARFDHQGAFASYRLGNRVFWTKNRVHIDATELVLTDGKNFARTRCGNRLSDTPQKPTTPDEPTEEALLYIPSSFSNRIIKLPADLENPPVLGLSRAYELSFSTPVPKLNEVSVSSLRVTSLSTGSTTNIPPPAGTVPEPASISLILSGGSLIGLAISRKRAEVIKSVDRKVA